MNEHRYILEPYTGMKSRYFCPGCNQKAKTFVRYIDTVTGEHLPSIVGRCNSESFCGYHYTPSQYFQDTNISIDTQQPKSKNNTKFVISTILFIGFNPIDKSLFFNHSGDSLIFIFEIVMPEYL